MVLPWISWPWISLVWHLKFPGRLAFTEVTGLWFPHEFLLCELELLFAKVAWSWSMWFSGQGLILEMIHVIVMPWELAIQRTCRFIVSPWISPAWIRTFLYKSFKFMVLPWNSWPWNSFVWHFNFLGSLALPFTEFCRFMVSPWISPAWIRTFLYKSFKFMVLPWISWPWISLVWHFEFPRMLAFAEVTGSWFPHEFPLCELELLFAKVAWS